MALSTPSIQLREAFDCCLQYISYCLGLKALTFGEQQKPFTEMNCHMSNTSHGLDYIQVLKWLKHCKNIWNKMHIWFVSVPEVERQGPYLTREPKHGIDFSNRYVIGGTEGSYGWLDRTDLISITRWLLWMVFSVSTINCMRKITKVLEKCINLLAKRRH